MSDIGVLPLFNYSGHIGGTELSDCSRVHQARAHLAPERKFPLSTLLIIILIIVLLGGGGGYYGYRSYGGRGLGGVLGLVLVILLVLWLVGALGTGVPIR
jgi:hypothetical protein